MDMVTAFRVQSEACGQLGSPMYEHLLARAADDIERGGFVRELLAGHEHDPGPSALALRLAGSVHRLVLLRRAPALAGYYPSVGGSWQPGPGWQEFLRTLQAMPEEIRSWLPRPPQTNEVGRAAALLGGLLRIGEDFRAPIRLLEIGSSAGLNLRADRFHVSDDHGRAHDPGGAAVRLERAWRGRRLRLWPDLEVVERTGSDIAPVDLDQPDALLRLMSYVWPDQPHRLARLEAAFATAREVPAVVRRQGAADFVDEVGLREGTITVLWHSVMWQYLSHGEQSAISRRVEALGSSATPAAPFAHLCLEPTRRTARHRHEFLVLLRLWPGGERRVLGSSVGHGVPTTWE